MYSYSILKLNVKILFRDFVPAYFFLRSPFSYKAAAGPSSDIEVEKRQALFAEAEKISKKNSFEPSKVPVPSFLQNC